MYNELYTHKPIDDLEREFFDACKKEFADDFQQSKYPYAYGRLWACYRKLFVDYQNLKKEYEKQHELYVNAKVLHAANRR